MIRMGEHPLAHFDFSVLRDPEFREDAVREEIIAPLLHALGYGVSGGSRIVRSRRLKQAYISLGSSRREVTLVPDYVMEIDGRPAWILEAKRPDRKLSGAGIEEQAYAYAIHPEIRAKYYALCNGAEFLLLGVDSCKPILHFPLAELGRNWAALYRLLSPAEFAANLRRGPVKDFGLHVLRLGFAADFQMNFYGVPLPYLAKIGENRYTFSANRVLDGCEYCVSFDFDDAIARRLRGIIPDDALDLLRRPLDGGSARRIDFPGNPFRANLRCVLSGELQEAGDEIFLPLWVTGLD